MKHRRGFAVVGVMGVLALVLLGSQLTGEAAGGVQLESTIEPLAGPLVIAVEDPGSIRVGKWTKLSAVVTNQTGVLLDDIQVELHSDSSLLVLKDSPETDVRALKPGASAAVKWSARCEQPVSLVVIAAVRGATPAGHELDAESTAVILRVDAKPHDR